MATDGQDNPGKAAAHETEFSDLALSDIPAVEPQGGAQASPLPPPRRRRHHRSATGVLSTTGSLAVHAGLLLAFAAVVWRTTSLSGPPDRDVSIAFDIPTLGEAVAPVPGTADAPPPPSSPPEPPRREAELRLDPPVTAESPSAEPVALESLATRAAAPIAPGPDDHAGARIDFAHAAAAEASAAATPAAPGQTTAGVVFAGLGASNARSVVYVLDASGSMVTSLPFVVGELRRSVSRLAPTQKFGVVLFRRLPDGSSGVEVFAPVLVRATPSAQERLAQWLSGVRPAGRSVPLEGLERAVAYRPDAVFLLSRAIERSGGDGWETAGGAAAARGLVGTLARVDQINPVVNGRRPAVIQTIQFLDEDPTGIMQEIGRVHGSRIDPGGQPVVGYRVIRRGEDLGGER